MKEIQVKVHDPKLHAIEIRPNGDWIDLHTAEEVQLEKGESRRISLGISMKLPEGYEAHLIVRSSTFGKYGIIQTNGMGIIDNSYSGDSDIWLLPVYATNDTVIPKNARIAQFRIVKRQEEVSISYVDHLSDMDRGGFGSTDDEEELKNQNELPRKYRTIPLDSQYQENFVYLKRAAMNIFTQGLLTTHKIPVYFFDMRTLIGYVQSDIQMMESTKSIDMRYVNEQAEHLIYTMAELFPTIVNPYDQIRVSPIIEQYETNACTYTYGRLTGFKITLESLIANENEYADIGLEASTVDPYTGVLTRHATERVLHDLSIKEKGPFTDSDHPFQAEIDIIEPRARIIHGHYAYFSDYLAFDKKRLYVRFYRDDLIRLITLLADIRESEKPCCYRKLTWNIQHTKYEEDTNKRYIRIMLQH